jgi:hypothetical protein
MAVIGVGAGAWLVAVFGRPGPAFLAALTAGILGRLLATLAGSVAAASRGRGALMGYLAGIGVGFVPLQLLEIAYFIRAGRRAARAGRA